MAQSLLCRTLYRSFATCGAFGVMLSASTGQLHAAGSNDDPFVRESIPQKWIDPLLAENLPPLKYPAYYTDLEKARAQWFAGRYKLSLITLRKIKDAKPEQLPEMAVIASRSLGELGRWDEALKAVSETATENDPTVQVRRAEVLAATGKVKEAIALLQKHLADHPDSIPGHFVMGQTAELIGDLDGAKKAYGWFVQAPQNYFERFQANEKSAPFDNAEYVTLMARAVDRHSELTGAYTDNAKLHHALLNTFVRAYDQIQRGYWPARLAAAEYFMSHDSKEEAAGELQGSEDDPKGVLTFNPRCTQAYKLLGLLSVGGFNFDGADKAINAIRQIDHDNNDANLLEARNLLQQRQPKEALIPIQKVLAKQPQNLEALGLEAAVYGLQLEEAKVDEVLKKVEAIDPDNATAYLEVASQLGAMRQYPRSAAKYQVAIERAPWWTDALNGLGLLYTQSGDEDQARATLERARTVDPFNSATTNYLKLLDKMDKFTKVETPHFVVMFDSQQDPVIPEYFGEYLESIHADVCKDFNHDPTLVSRGKTADGKDIYHKTVIEVFAQHDDFSVRTTGSPWIGTVGASTGRIIALVSPRKGEKTMGTYNWAQVLRHEYTHTVTLSATDNRIQHWMTEGLAVQEEKSPPRWDWVPMLYNAVKKHELFPMDKLTWGFVRPKRPIDRTLAYAQSAWVCQYIDETYGHEKLLKMLDRFRDAGRQEDVFPEITGKKIPDFEKDFFAWCEKQVAAWGYDPETSKKYADLTKKADEQIKNKQFDAAISAYEEIVKIRPADAMPHQKLSGLYLATKQLDKAVQHLEALDKVELKDNRYAKRIAQIYRNNKEYDKAGTYGIQAVYIDPYDLSAHELLADIYEKAGNKEEALKREQRVIPILTKWIEDQKKEKSGEVSLKE